MDKRTSSHWMRSVVIYILFLSLLFLKNRPTLEVRHIKVAKFLYTLSPTFLERKKSTLRAMSKQMHLRCGWTGWGSEGWYLRSHSGGSHCCKRSLESPLESCWPRDCAGCAAHWEASLYMQQQRWRIPEGTESYCWINWALKDFVRKEFDKVGEN